MRMSHAHQDSVNGSCLSSFEKHVHRNIVNAVKKMSGESRRMCRDCVTMPFSKVMKRDARSAVVALQSRARSVKYAKGTVATPRQAGTIRMAT